MGYNNPGQQAAGHAAGGRHAAGASGWSWAMDTWVGCQSRLLNASAQVFSVLTNPMARAITRAAMGGRERILLLFGRVIMQSFELDVVLKGAACMKPERAIHFAFM